VIKSGFFRLKIALTSSLRGLTHPPILFF